MSDFKTRLIEEHDQLQQRIEKLEAFIISSDEYAALLNVERIDLNQQLNYMKNYFVILVRRVSRMKKAEK